VADTPSNVVPLHTPAQRALLPAYTESLATMTIGEKAAYAHFRGWPHFGPACPECMGGKR
jgi:hypothetical protein